MVIKAKIQLKADLDTGQKIIAKRTEGVHYIWILDLSS